jgi:hypothetical protein
LAGTSSGNLRHRSLTLLLPLAAVLVTGPAMAKVLAEGQANGGYYWQKIEADSGKVRYLCRANSDAKIQKAASCNAAWAVKP